MLMAIDSLNKKFNEKELLHQVTFSIDDHDKIALVGINGTGKSTLLKILMGIETYESGNIIRKKGLNIHYLCQNPTFKMDTIWNEIKSCNKDNIHPVEDYELKTILTRLGFKDLDEKISSLSGGQKKRLALACALSSKCDLLLLDEPTNHLDHDMIEWLENYLVHIQCAIFMVSHDRYFLNHVCNKIMEIDQGDLYVHDGNFERYLEAKAEREQLEQARIQKYHNLYRKELEWVRAGVQARGTKSNSRLQRFEELRNMRFKKQSEKLELQVSMQRLGKKTIEWHDLGFAYGDKVLFENFSYNLLRNDRIGIIGPNGCGKSTFMDCIAKIKQPTNGSIEYGTTINIGYFRQADQGVDLEMRMIDYIEEVAKVVEYDDMALSASQMLERFLFPRSMHYTKLGRLSGGERRRLYLLRVLMQKPNILLLDEPTNDLDILTLEVLEDYLDHFNGAILTISHDRYFLDRVVDKVFVYKEDHTFKQYSGGYSDYLDIRKDDVTIKSEKKHDTRNKRVNTLTYMEKKELETLIDRLEALEAEIKGLEYAINENQDDYQKMLEYSQKRDEKQEELDMLSMRWLELEEKREMKQ